MTLGDLYHVEDYHHYNSLLIDLFYGSLLNYFNTILVWLNCTDCD